MSDTKTCLEFTVHLVHTLYVRKGLHHSSSASVFVSPAGVVQVVGGRVKSLGLPLPVGKLCQEVRPIQAVLVRLWLFFLANCTGQGRLGFKIHTLKKQYKSHLSEGDYHRCVGEYH